MRWRIRFSKDLETPIDPGETPRTSINKIENKDTRLGQISDKI